MKTCIKCNIEKPLDEFYYHKTNKDKKSNKCKDCTKLYAIKYRKKMKRIGKLKKIDWSKYYEKRLTYRLLFPEKIKAQQSAISIVAPKNKDRHHWNYNEEYYLDVIFLNKNLHVALHRNMIYDPDNKMFRGLLMPYLMKLLDTKEIHMEYINFVAEKYKYKKT